MKTILSVFLFLATFIPAPAQQPCLQIHQIGLADGDAALIIIVDSTVAAYPNVSRLDTAVILIDAQREYCAVQLSAYIDSVLTSIHRKTLDYVVLSHVHIDHYGSMVAVLNTLLSKGYRVTALFDRLNIVVPGIDWSTDAIDSCYSYVSVPSLSAAANAYAASAKANNAGGVFAWTAIQPGQDLLYYKAFKYISMTCLSAKGRCLIPGGDTVFIPQTRLDPPLYKPKSENDLSYSFLIRFQGFSYFTGGDLGGGGTYADGEKPIARYLANLYGANFHFCAFKVSHHGSSHSTNASFLGLMKPTLAIVPAALRSYSGTQLPTGTTIGNLRAINDSIRYTFIPSNPTAAVNSWNLGYLQDVILTIPAPPGFGVPIVMNMNLRRRNRMTRLLDGTVVSETITCTKTH